MIWHKKILFLVYFLTIVLATPASLFLPVKLAFWLFSAYIFYIYISHEVSHEVQLRKLHEVELREIWLLVPLAIILITRLIPLFHWPNGIPLGADVGVYFRNFQKCFADLPKGGCPNSAVSFISNLLYLFGWQTNDILYGFYLIISLFLGLSLYLAAKEFLGKTAAFFSLLLFSLSTSQFLAYFAFYWKMMLAMGLTLTAFYLLKKKSWLVIPVAGFMGSLHAVSFVPFGLSMVLYFIFGKERIFTFFSGLGILAVYLSVSWRQFFDFLPYYTEKFGLIRGYSPEFAELLKGQFIDLGLYQRLALIYLPFAVLGLIALIKERKFNYLFFYFVVNAVMVYFNFIFHNRFIILFDLAAIILAGGALAAFVERFWDSLAGKLLVVLLLAAGLFGIFYQSWLAEPFLTDNRELNEIKSLAGTEPDALVIANSYLYRPFLVGFSQREVLFGKGKESLMDRPDIYRILDQYDRPLYIYVGEKEKGAPDLSKNSRFEKISEHVWKYN